jgi:lysophospholipase L1-like esterase
MTRAVLLMAILTLSVRAEDSLRYLALGDSYTIGESVEEKERWPVQLAALLREKKLNVANPRIIARTGWTTAELSAGIDRAAPEGKFELVSLLIGVNNQFRGLSEDEYRKEFVALLKRSIAFAGDRPGRVVVLSIPDYGATPFGKARAEKIGAAIDRFNAINKEESEKAKVHYVDVTPASREGAKDAALVAADGLHPSGKQYAEWAKLALPMAEKALEK